MAKPLKGTKTHGNLKDAFAGESQANRRYLYFARRADIEGYPDIGGLFRDTSEAETGHAFGHLEPDGSELGGKLLRRLDFGEREFRVHVDVPVQGFDMTVAAGDLSIDLFGEAIGNALPLRGHGGGQQGQNTAKRAC